jgi:hypothetical protein
MEDGVPPGDTSIPPAPHPYTQPGGGVSDSWDGLAFCIPAGIWHSYPVAGGLTHVPGGGLATYRDKASLGTPAGL